MSCAVWTRLLGSRYGQQAPFCNASAVRVCVIQSVLLGAAPDTNRLFPSISLSREGVLEFLRDLEHTTPYPSGSRRGKFQKEESEATLLNNGARAYMEPKTGARPPDWSLPHCGADRWIVVPNQACISIWKRRLGGISSHPGHHLCKSTISKTCELLRLPLCMVDVASRSKRRNTRVGYKNLPGASSRLAVAGARMVHYSALIRFVYCLHLTISRTMQYGPPHVVRGCRSRHESARVILTDGTSTVRKCAFNIDAYVGYPCNKCEV